MIKKVFVLLATMLLINSTYANPEGGVVSAGSATISSPDAATVQINQASDKAIINWNSFNISADETTRFVQPNAGSVALNRINPQQGASQIFGQIQANGKIILVNQAGIYFGPGSRVDVAGIIASTTDITDENFLAGYYKFDQKSPLYNGSIINKGTLISANNGLIALVGSAVSNEGMIQAHLGNVVLASGNKFTVGFDDTGLLNFAIDEAATSPGIDQQGKALKNAVNNSGTIIADGGTILMSAKSAQGVMDHVINMTGVAQARSVQQKNGVIILGGDDEGITYVSGTLDASGINVGETGGIVQVLGHYIYMDGAASVNVSGDQGGGNIYIGGNYQGKGPLPNAETTFVAQDVKLNADALTQGNGGQVIAWANVATGFEGSISAQGGVNGGNGGFAETSGKEYLNVDTARINLGTSLGEVGSWLLDPTNITISAAANSNILFSGGTYSANPSASATSNINVTTLNTNLGTSNVLVTTASSGASTGTINITGAINWSSQSTLTLTSNDTITVGAGITSGNAAGVGSFGSITFNSGANIIVNSPISSISGTIGLNAPSGTITLNSTLSSTGLTGAITLSPNAIATNSILLNAGSGVTTSSASQTYNSNTTTLATGATITLNSGSGNMTFTSIDGAANLTLNSSGTINVTSGHIGTNTALTTFTSTGGGIITSNTGTLFSPSITTTGNQSYSTSITSSGGSVFLNATGATSTITLNSAINNSAGSVTLRARGGVLLNCAACNPIINAGTLGIDNGFVTTPLTLLANAVITTNTASATNTFNGALTGAFALTLNEASGSTNNFAGTVNIGSLTVNAGSATSTSSFNGGNVTTSGAQSYGGPVNLGASSVFSGSALSFKNITANANNLGLTITTNANALTLGGTAAGITGTGTLTISPLAATTVGINTGAGTLQLDTTKFDTTFSGVTIGQAAATGAMTIGGAANFGSETVSLNGGSIVNGAAFVITAGTLNLTSTTATGIGTLANRIGVAATNLTLNTATNNGSAFISATGNIALGTSTFGTGAINLTSTGAITQTGTLTQAAGGTANTFTTGAFAINLNLSNSLRGAVSLTNTGANNVTLTNSLALSLGASSVGSGTLSLIGAGITQTGAITQAAGGGAVTINGGAGVITLSNASNSFTGAVSLTNSGANAVNLNNGTTALSLGNVSVGTSTLTLAGVGISQGANTITQAVGGGAVTLTGGAGAITLGSANTLRGAVAITNSGANNVSLNNSIALSIAASSVGTGTLSLTGVGISQTGAITQAVGGGAITINGGAGTIVLGSANTLRGAVSLNNTGANNVSLTNSTALSMGTSSVGQNLSLTAGGTISQVGALTVGAGITASTTVATSDILLGTQANNIASTVGFAGTLSNIRDVSLQNTNAAATIPALTSVTNLRNLTLNFANAAVTFPTAITLVSGGSLSVTSLAISQTGALVVPGTSSFTAGANAITLGAANSFTGAVSLSNSGANNVSLNNTIALNVGASTVGSGTLSLTGVGVTQSGAIVQAAGAGTATINAGAGVITLATAGNTFTGAVALTNSGANAVSLSNGTNALTLGNISVGTSTLALTGVGITQSGGTNITQAVGGGAITITGGAGVITLNGVSNTLRGALALSNSGANNVSVNNSIALSMGASTVGTGSLSLTGVGITQTGAITQTAGAGAVTLNGGAGVITLGSANGFTGSVSLNNSGANAVSLTNNAALSLGTSSVGQNLSLTANGSISQVGALTVPGTTTLAVSAAASDILLGTQANNFTGAVGFGGTLTNIRDFSLQNTNAGATISSFTGLTNLRNLTLNFTNAALTFPTAITLTSGGSLVATGLGISQSGALVVPGTSSFTAGANAITLGLSNSFTGAVTLSNSGANNVSVNNSIALNVGASSVGTGTLSLTGVGVTQSGIISQAAAAGAATINAGAGVITLNSANNFTGAVSLNNSGANAVSLTNAIALSLGTSSVGNSTLSLTGVGITQTGAITQAVGGGNVSINAGAGVITLNSANNFRGAVSLNNSGANNASITNAIGLTLGASTLGQNLTATSSGAIAQSGALSAQQVTTSSSGGTLLTNASNAISTFSATNTTSGDIQLTTASPSLSLTTLSQSGTGQILISNTAGTVATSNAIAMTGSGNIGLSASGALSINNQINTTAGNATFTGSSINLGANVITTGGNILFNSPLTLTAGVNLTTGGSGTLTFANTVQGNQALAFTAGGGATFNNTVSNVNSITAVGNVNVNTTSISTLNHQGYNDTVFLGGSGNTTFTSVNSGGIIFAGRLDGPQGLIIAPNSGNIIMGSNQTTPLASILIGTGNSTFINTLSPVVTTGSQTYNSAVGFANDQTLTTTNSAIFFGSTVSGSSGTALTLNSGSGNITVTGAASALGAFTLNSSGTTTLGSTVNAASITTNAGGTTAINGGGVTTTGAQNYNDAVTLGQDSIFTTTNNLVNFASTISNATTRSLTVNAGTAAITLGGNVGTGTALNAIALNSTGTTTLGGTLNAASLTTDTGGTTAINGTAVTTSGAQTYNDAVTFGAGSLTTLTSSGGSGITFNTTVNGPQGFSIANNSGAITFNSTIGNTLASILIGTGNPTAINGASIQTITTTGSQTYNSAVTLSSGSFAFFGSNGGAGITFGSTVNGSRSLLTAANSGAITFGGIIGGTTPLTTLFVDTGSPTAINTTAITTLGSQTYNSAVTLGASGLTTLTSNNGSNIRFNDALDGPQALSIGNNSGVITFAGVVGGGSPLASLTVGTGNSITLSTTDVTTIGSQTYNGPVNINQGSLLTLSTTNSAINFGSNITNTLARSLTLNTGNADINMNGNVGSGTALDTLTLNSTGVTTLGNAINAANITTNAGGSTVINASSLTTSGSQTYNDAVSLGGATAARTFTASAFTLASTLSAAANNLNIFANTISLNGGSNSVTGSANIQLGGQSAATTIGLGGGAGTLNIGNTTLTALSGFNLLTIGQVAQSGVVTVPTITLNTPTTIQSTTGIDLSGTIATLSTNALTLNGPVTLSANTTIGGANGDVNFNSSITNSTSRNLTLNAGTGNITLSGNVGAGTALGALIFNSSNNTTLAGTINAASITTDVGGTTAINGGSVTTSGAQTYNDAITLGADSTFTTTNSNVNFASTLSNATSRALTINAGSGAITLSSDVGVGTALDAMSLNSTGLTTLGGTINAASLTTDAGGTTAINGGDVTTSGTQTYNDAVTLGNDTTFNTTDNTVTFGSTISNAAARGLTINAGNGAISLGGNVGVGTALGAIALNSTDTTTLNGTINATSLTTDAGGSTVINGGSVVTSGAQNYNDAVILGADTIFSTTNNIVNFASTLSNTVARALTINAGNAAITLGGAIGTGTALGAITLNSTDTTTLGDTVSADSLTTNAGGSTAINGGSVTTSGTQNYNDSVSLALDTTLTGTGISLNALNGNTHNLTLSDSGTSTLNGAITNVVNLLANAITFNNSGVATSGSQTYNGTATLSAATLLSSTTSDITFNSALVGGAQTLTLTGGAGGDHTFTLNDITSLGSLAVNGNATVNNTLALLTNNGTNTWTVTNNGGASGSNGTVAATNLTSGSFNNIQNLTSGDATNSFVFNDGAAINGSITNNGNAANSTFDASAYTTPIDVYSNGSAPGIVGGSINNVSNYKGSDTLSSAISTFHVSLNTTITSKNTGTLANSTHFTGFGNITGNTSDNTTYRFSANASITGNLTASTGPSNTFIFSDGSSIGGNLTGTGTDTLSVAGFTTPVTVNLNGSSPLVLGSITGINSFAGTDAGSGTNSTLIGPSGSNNWIFTGGAINTGTIGGTISFSDFGNVTDGSDNNTFTFQDNASITGNLTGGSHDILDYSAYTSPIAINITNNLASTATGIGGTFSGFNNIVGGSASNSLTNTTGNQTWTISNDNAGSIAGRSFSAFGALVGGANDTFALGNGKSIGSISASNGTLDYSAYTSAVAVNGTTNTATNVGSLTGITSFVGGSGSNTFTNTSGSNTWNISNNNAGSIAGKNFSVFGNLVGGASDTFALADGKTIGSISATNGTLDYSAYTTNVAVNGGANTATGVGSLSGIINFTGGSGSNTFTNTAGSNTWNISNNNAGSIAGKNFSVFGNLVGGASDIFALGNGKSIGSISASNGTLDYSAYTSAVAVNGATNTATNVSSLTGITSFVGGSGSNTFTNTAGGNTWNISNNNAGSIAGKNFSVFGNLVGGASDTFALADGKTIGSISASSGTLDYSAYTSAVAVNGATNTATNVGSLTGITSFVGGSGSNTFTNTAGSNTWNISNNNAGSITGKNFSVFGNLVGGASDTFALADGKTIGSISATNGTLDYSAYTTNVAVNGGANTATGVGSLSGISNFTGGSGSNTFTNTAGSNTWNISNNNAGSIAGKNFSVFGNLVGGASDTFALADGKTIGSISATNGTLDYSAYTTNVAVNGGANTATGVGSLSGISNFTGGSGSNTFTNTAGSNTWNISNNNAGSIAGKNFTVFGNLVGGASDTFALADGKTIGSISASSNGTLNLSAYTSDVTVNGGANTATGVGSLSGISNFTGGTGNNTFTNTAGSNTWNISNNNAGSIAGKNFSVFGNLVGGASDTFALADGKTIGSISATNGTLDYSAYTTNVAVNGGANTATGVGSLSGISNFTGGTGSNTFTNTAGSNTWNISNNNAGSIAGKSFSVFGTLVGGANDIFALGNGKTIGSISASNGTLNYSAYTSAVAVNGATNTATNVGSLTGITSFVGGSGSNSFTNSTGGNTWNISNNNAGSIAGKNFSVFGNLVGGASDTFALADGKSISSITATNGTLDYSAYTSNVTVNNSANSATNVGSVNGITQFKGGTGSNTFMDSTGSNTWTITNNNVGNVAGKSFNAFGSLTGGNSDVFIFANTSAHLSGNLAGSGNASLNVSAFASPIINLQTQTSTGLSGTFSGFSSFTGNGVNSNLIGADNTTWHISSLNGGTAGGSTFTNFGNLANNSGTNNFILDSGGSIGGGIAGGSGNNTLTVASGNPNWTITGTNLGSVTGVTGGFTNIQNLVGSSTGTNTFNMIGNGTITGQINGGNTTQINTINYSASTQALTLNLSIPSSGSEINSGTIDNQSITNSFVNLQAIVGASAQQNVIILPNKPTTVVYTNPQQTAGYIGDPFFFTNFTIQGATPPAPTPTPDPAPVDPRPLPDVAQIITPFTQGSTFDNTSPIISMPSVEVNIDQIIEQQLTLDTQIAHTLSVGCYQITD